MSGAVILEIRNVTRCFGGLAANKNISMNVRRGEILALIGPNGAGKSTLFNLIAGTFSPTSGQIVFDGEDISSMPGARRCSLGVARTFQVPRSFDSMKVVENVMVGSLVRYPAIKTAREAAWKVLEFVGLADAGEVQTNELTPPEKRRLELARALATEPKLLLLDEVMAGLTPTEAQKGIQIVRRAREAGVTIVMVEHVMEVVMPLVDRAVVLHYGEVLAEGHPKDVVRNESVIAAYLGDRRRATS